MYANSEIVERIRKLARERKTSLTKIETELNFGNGMIGKWAKAPKSPPYDKLLKIADHLNISVETLVGEEKTSAPLSDAEVRMEKIKEIEALLNKMDDETIIDVIKYAEYLASREGKSDEK